MLLQPFLVLGADLKIILQNNRLTIQIEASEITALIQLVQERIDQSDKPYMMLLIG
ncbi:hypothetical protein D3C80_1754050 [compost metagenome]